MAAAVGMVSRGCLQRYQWQNAMCKAARVTLVGYEKVSGARYTIIVRGNISDVEVSAGVDAAQRVASSKKTLLLSSHVIARLHETSKLFYHSTISSC